MCLNSFALGLVVLKCDTLFGLSKFCVSNGYICTTTTVDGLNICGYWQDKRNRGRPSTQLQFQRKKITATNLVQLDKNNPDILDKIFRDD